MAGFYGGYLGNQGALDENNSFSVSPAVRFNPAQLNVQPRPGYNLLPGYNPTRMDLERDRFILHNPRSGVAGNPFGPDFVIPQQRPAGVSGPQLNPLRQTHPQIFPKDQGGRKGAIDVQFRQAFNLGSPGAIGNMGGMEFAQSQFPSTPVYYDEQMKQLVPRSGTPSSTPVKNYPGLGIAPKVPFV